MNELAQRSDVWGNQNIVVQVVGDGNHIDIHRPRLTLVHHGILAARDDIGLLYAQARAIPVFGREDTLAGLREWANGELPIAIRVVVGGGGSGKTRLSLELCDLLADDGWDAGFLTSAELSRFVSQQNLASWGWSKPTLVVVDYAASQSTQLRTWFAELAHNPGAPGRPLRLLLLERHADPNGGWWQDAFVSGRTTTYQLQGMLDPPMPVPLLPLAPPARRQVFEAMLDQLGGTERMPTEGAEAFDKQLSELSWGGDPLYLMLAASRAAEAGVGHLLALNRTELVMSVAEAERARQARLGESRQLPKEVLWRMAALVTLCGGLSWEQVADSVPGELQALRLPSAGDPGAIANAVREALPGLDGRVAPVLPDAIGEAFLLSVLGTDNAGDEVVARAWALEGRAVEDTLIRCAQDFGQTDDRPPLTWLCAIVDALEEPARLQDLLNRLPASSVALRVPALRLTLRVKDALSDDGSESSRAARAGVFAELARRLMGAGVRDNAVAAAEEAVAIYRELSARNPDAFCSDLARSCMTLASCLSDTGEHERALELTEEAVAIWRELAARRPGTFNPELAMSLNNLANHLSHNEDRIGARVSAREAVAIYRELVARNPDAFRPALAKSLNTLAIRLSDTGERDGALAPAKETVAIYRELAARNPDAFSPNLGASLHNLSKHLREAGDREGVLARALANDAVAIFQELAARNPDAFRPDLAKSLNTLANCLSDAGERKGALAPAKKAVAIYRELSAKNPGAFRSDLAMSLNSLAILLRNTGNLRDALASAKESVAIRRELVARNPDAFLPVLATSLHNLANCLSDIGEHKPALGVVKEAVAIRRELAERNPAAFRADLAKSLTTLANCLSGTGEREDALERAKEAAEIFQDMAARNPDAVSADLAVSLHNLAIRLFDTGDRGGALATAREAVAIYRGLDARNPDAFRPDLSVSLNNLANCLSEAGDREGAPTPAREAVEALGPYFLRWPHAFAKWMAIIVFNYLMLCAKSNTEPDNELLGPLVAKLNEMEGEACSLE